MKLFVIFGILIGLKQADAIDCYNCVGLGNLCNDPFKASGVPTIPCLGSCLKTKASNTQTVVRTCFPSTLENKCIDVTYNGVTGTTCYCNGNLCNYALPASSSIIVMAASMIIYIAFH